MIPGRYKGRAASWGLGHSEKGTPQIAIELQVTEGDLIGESITLYGAFTDAAHPYTFKTMRTLGWEGDDLGDLTGIDKNEVSFVVAEEEYNGERKLKVKGVYPLGVALKNPMTPEQTRAFAAQMKGAAVASRGANPYANKSKSQVKRENVQAGKDPFGDEDPPF